MADYDERLANPTDNQVSELLRSLNGTLASTDYEESADPGSLELISIYMRCLDEAGDAAPAL